jgi:feruloyl esterase
VLRALARWREMNVAPDAIVATKYVDDNPALGIAFQRPICPYPKLPRYDGAGLDPKKATSFSCL